MQRSVRTPVDAFEFKFGEVLQCLTIRTCCRAFSRAARIFGGGRNSRKKVAFPPHEVITKQILYAASQDDPVGHLKLRPDLYGEFRPDQYYAAFGYLHVTGLVPTEAVDALVHEYNKTVKPYTKPLMRQSTRSEVNQLDSAGAVLNPLLNPHQAYRNDPELGNLSERILDVACNRRVHAALASLTPYPQHCMTQTMLFEQSVTPAHQDWVYLDTIPAGNLTAVWIALEDISPDAARFFIVPGSQNFRHFFPEEAVLSANYFQEMSVIHRERFEARQVVPSLKNGDVVFWNSRLIHGSIPGTNPSRTRLSLAIHTIPKGFRYGNVYREMPLRLKGTHQSMFFT